MRPVNEAVFTSGDMSGNLNSAPFPLQFIFWFSIQLVWTGVPVGSFKLQASNDPGADPVTGDGVTNWTDISGSTVNVNGAAGNYMFIADNVSYRWVRLVWTFTSGTGSVNARINAKGN